MFSAIAEHWRPLCSGWRTSRNRGAVCNDVLILHMFPTASIGTELCSSPSTKIYCYCLPCFRTVHVYGTNCSSITALGILPYLLPKYGMVFCRECHDIRNAPLISILNRFDSLKSAPITAVWMSSNLRQLSLILMMFTCFWGSEK